jgi:hypothetical protein
VDERYRQSLQRKSRLKDNAGRRPLRSGVKKGHLGEPAEYQLKNDAGIAALIRLGAEFDA